FASALDRRTNADHVGRARPPGAGDRRATIETPHPALAPAHLRGVGPLPDGRPAGPLEPRRGAVPRRQIGRRVARYPDALIAAYGFAPSVTYKSVRSLRRCRR